MKKYFLSVLFFYFLLLNVEFAHAQIPSYVPTNGLVGYWPFNGNANDESGNGNDGNIFGNFNFVSNDQDRFNCIELIGDTNSSPVNAFGEPLYVNGGYFKFPNLTGAISNSISINLWIRCLSNVPHGYPFFAGIDDFGQNRLVFDYYSGFSIGNNHPLAMVSYPFNSNIAEWKMLTMVYSPGDLKAFINGQFIGNNNNIITSIPLANAALNWNIWSNGNSARGWSIYDDIAIYNRALTQQEITQLYNGCSNPLVSEFNASACEQYQLPWGGNLVTNSGDYSNTYQTSSGCDSIVTAHVVINHAVAGSSFNASGTSTYTLPWGQEVTTSGYYNHLYQNINGCDSLVTAYVVINTPQNTANPNVGINVTNPQRSLHVKDAMRLEPRDTPLENPVKGDIYFDGVLNKLRVYDGVSWQNCW